MFFSEHSVCYLLSLAVFTVNLATWLLYVNKLTYFALRQDRAWH